MDLLNNWRYAIAIGKLVTYALALGCHFHLAIARCTSLAELTTKEGKFLSSCYFQAGEGGESLSFVPFPI
jgi:hypothetical protein